MQALLLYRAQLPMVAAHQAEQPSVLAALRVVLLPEFQKMLIHQPNDMESVGPNLGIGEVLLSDSTRGFSRQSGYKGSSKEEIISILGVLVGFDSPTAHGP